MPGFSSTIAPGKSVSIGNGTSASTTAAATPHSVCNRDSPADVATIEAERVELEQEADDEDEDEAFSRDLLDILTVSLDGMKF